MDVQLLTPEQTAALLNLQVNLPSLFLWEEYPDLLAPLWQMESIQEKREMYGKKRVIIE